MKTPIIINLFGSSGAGKSTTALGLSYHLKLLGFKVEYVSEYAKDLVAEESFHKLKHQLYVFAKQSKRIDVLMDKGLDFIVSDSPTYLSYFYGEKYKTNIPFLKDVIIHSFLSQNSINYFLVRTLDFDPSLRLQSSEESDMDSEALLSSLHNDGIEFTKLLSKHNTVDKILSDLSHKKLI